MLYFQLRNFSALLLHTNNMFSRDVSVFKSAKVYFSVGGVYFTSSPIVFQHSPDRSSESARQVIIPVVSGRVGRSVRLSLQFDLRWIMISEVRFVSGKRTRISFKYSPPFTNHIYSTQQFLLLIFYFTFGRSVKYCN